MWLIDEKAKIFLRELWVRPPNAPIKVDKIMKENKTHWVLFICSKREAIRIKGAAFCQVRIKKVFTQEHPLKICGTQKWRGAAPSLSIKAKKIIKLKK